MDESGCSIGSFPGWQEMPLFRRCWRPPQGPRASLVLVHGIGGHAGLFAGVARHLTPLGCEVHALDLPGHGLSPGPRGWIPGWEAFRVSVRRFLARVEAETKAPGPPLLLGHSLGGTIVLDLVLDGARPGGVILSNPALGAGGVDPWRLLLARSLAKLWPRFSLATGIPLDACSRDPAECERLAADPLCHSRCSARLAAEFLATARSIGRRAASLQLPLLLLQSGADPITPPGPARRLFETVGSADRTWRCYPDSLHELWVDLDRERVLADLADWLAAHGG
jgi:alpha-beta hydrolase superfamily lysophospholipase